MSAAARTVEKQFLSIELDIYTHTTTHASFDITSTPAKMHVQQPLSHSLVEQLLRRITD